MNDQTNPNDLAAMAAELPVPGAQTVATPEGDKGPVAAATAGIQAPAEGTLADGPIAANDPATSNPLTSQVPDGAPAGQQLPNPPGSEPDPAVVAATETKNYADGTSVTGPGPLPEQSPAQQDALHAKATAAMEQAPVADTPILPTPLTGSDRQPSQFVYENGSWKATYTIGEVVSRACAENGMSATQWNSLDSDQRETLIAAQVAKIKAIVEGTAVQRPDGLHNTIKELEVAKALPELSSADPFEEAVHHEGAIQHFMDDAMSLAGQAERRVMRIVADAEGKLRKLHVPDFGT